MPSSNRHITAASSSDEALHRIWPETVNRLGPERLWAHLMDILILDRGRFPDNWEQNLKTLDAPTLIRAFKQRIPLFSTVELYEPWGIVKNAARIRLQEIEPRARIAFGMYPENEGQALKLLAQLPANVIPCDTLVLPALDDDAGPFP